MTRTQSGCGSRATTRAPGRRKDAMRSPTCAPMSSERASAVRTASALRAERVSFRLDAGIAYLPAPALQLLENKMSQLLRAARSRFEAHLAQLLADRGLVDARYDLAIQASDHA